ncbi:site-specific integrase [Pseudomonas aeruginosa]|jgi:integrase|uniref:site-specific integrase n=2 Tax=Pseudomonas TaxID=286 RepID=UPI00053E5CAA|nr:MULTISPECIES: site-specific integrase [Pseudomonas]MBA5207984.1 site-specific integrase [Pseudomonas aeruginosa]MBG4574034.1 site-specific integrase [Pseudomonas aeruginosa]MBM9966500.1 site-specific integrase [Pseudomonas aeruginosa]MBN0096894.1 site-specific integrase [Pseudomonas aeruginosa]MBN0272119.1 site-specific integrase [Pseudomonas aeruginosa]
MLFIPTPTSKLKPILEYYVETVSIRKRSYKTEVYRIKALSSLLGDLVFNEIKPIHVVAYRDKRLATPHPRDSTKTLATSTVKLELMLLSHLFTTAITEWGMEDLINPVEKIRKPKAPPGRTRRLSPAEEKKVLRGAWRHPNKEVYAIIVLALETAMRQGEILSLRWENISWQKRTVLLPLTKNGDPREVPLSKAAYDILRNHMTPLSEGRVFSYTSNGLKSSWRIFVKGLGIDDLHFHDLRHCAISSLLERGLNTIEVASISGHKSMAMLKRYSHLMTYKLVAKLDPKPRAKKDRPILRDHLRAYPAVVTEYTHRVDVDFPDFIDLRLSGKTADQAIEGAQANLLRKVVTLLCDGTMPPEPSPPDSICLPTHKSRVEIISPI